MQKSKFLNFRKREAALIAVYLIIFIGYICYLQYNFYVDVDIGIGFSGTMSVTWRDKSSFGAAIDASLDVVRHIGEIYHLSKETGIFLNTSGIFRYVVVHFEVLNNTLSRDLGYLNYTFVVQNFTLYLDNWVGRNITVPGVIGTYIFKITE